MPTVKSNDGTAIGYDRMGEGPVVIIVDGALSVRGRKSDLARLLGTSGAPFMLETAKTLSRTIPGAELRTLVGQAHDVHAEVLAPVLAEFFELIPWR